MAIRFDQLPADKPGFSLPEKGQYTALIEKAEMKTPKNDPTKPPYLNLTLSLTDAEGKNKGKIFDIISESDNDYVRYKLKRFIEAMRIPITGSIELKDICKVVQGKTMLVDTTIDDKQDPPRAVVDIFNAEIFYPLDQAPVTAPINAPDALASDDEDTPFTVDAPPTTQY